MICTWDYDLESSSFFFLAQKDLEIKKKNDEWGTFLSKFLGFVLGITTSKGHPFFPCAKGLGNEEEKMTSGVLF